MGILFAAIAAMGSLFHELGYLLRKPKYRAIFIWMFLVISLDTVFFRLVEGWSWLDSLYFSVITYSTVRCGDFSPTTAVSKIFTMEYIFLGISIFASSPSMLAKAQLEMAKERHATAPQRRKD